MAHRVGRVGACEKQRDTVRQMAEAGATLQAIGAAVGTTKNRVRDFLIREGIERPVWRTPPPGSHPMARPASGPLNAAWNGGRMVDKSGYILLWMPGHPEANRHGQVREHRIVMSRVLGRPLKRGEVVDHINGDTGDNRPENLRLFSSNGEHLRVTLTGVPCPARGRKRAANQAATGTGDLVLPGTSSRSQG